MFGLNIVPSGSEDASLKGFSDNSDIKKFYENVKKY